MIADVREADELEEEEGKIEGALNMPLGQLVKMARYSDLKDLKGRKFVLTVLMDIEEIWLPMS